jgi:hypothetical protein
MVMVRLCRCHRLLAQADALAEPERAHQAGNARVDMHDRAAGEVERAPLPDETGGGVHRLGLVRRGIGIRPRPVPHHARDRALKVNQMTRNSSTAENLMRSTTEPRIRQQVIAAKVAWNAT